MKKQFSEMNEKKSKQFWTLISANYTDLCYDAVIPQVTNIFVSPAEQMRDVGVANSGSGGKKAAGAASILLSTISG